MKFIGNKGEPVLKAKKSDEGRKYRMTDAAAVMNKMIHIKDELDHHLPKKESDVLWKKAEEKLDQMLKQYASIPKEYRIHTDSRIFPAASVYLTLKEHLGKDEAYRMVEEPILKRAESIGKKLAVLMRIPGVPGLFVKMWDPLTRKLFGEKNGFQNVFYPKQKDEFRMDIISCPYVRYFKELGCPELTKIYCTCDDKVYGRLPGLRFQRNETIGRGGERCDFCIRRIRR